MTRINRRQFLAGAAGLLASAPWWSRLAFAQEGPAHKNLILVIAGGGWDISYALDPKPGIATVDSPPGEVKLFDQMPIMVGDDRPAVETFFSTFGSQAAVINGIQVNSIAHPECTKRMMTGTGNESDPDVGAIIGFEQGADLPVPYMALGNAAFSGPFTGTTGRAGVTNQLVALLDPRLAYVSDSPHRDRFVPTNDEQALIQSYLTDRAEADKALRGQRGYNKRQIEDFVSSLSRGERLKDFSESFGARGAQLTLDEQFDLAVQLIDGGVSRAVTTQDINSWDSHQGNHQQQAILHNNLYGALNNLAANLERRNLFDDTIVVVISEMSRTPKLNPQQGKDHWPITSALAFGGGIAGGQTFGGTNDLVEGLNVHMGTGKVADAGGTGLEARNLMCGVLKLAGVDPTTYFRGIPPLFLG